MPHATGAKGGLPKACLRLVLSFGTTRAQQNVPTAGTPRGRAVLSLLVSIYHFLIGLFSANVLRREI